MMYGGGYGYRGGYYGVALMAHGVAMVMRTETHVSQYTEGTFNIDHRGRQ